MVLKNISLVRCLTLKDAEMIAAYLQSIGKITTILKGGLFDNNSFVLAFNSDYETGFSLELFAGTFEELTSNEPDIYKMPFQVVDSINYNYAYIVIEDI